MTPTSNRRIATSVGELFVETWGDPQNPATVVAWPSLFCDGRTLSLQAAALAPTHRVLVIDGAGHGRSGPPPGRFSLGDCARAVGEVLDSHGAKRAIYLGCAWGGHVGVPTALQLSDRIAALIVINSPMNAWRGAQRLQLLALYNLFRFLGPRDFLVELVLNAQLAPDVRRAHPERAAMIADCVRSSEHHGLTVAIRSAMLDRPSLVERLPELNLPTLFIVGAADKLYPEGLARRHAEQIRGVEFCAIAGSAHQSGLERPDEVNRLILAFVARIKA